MAVQVVKIALVVAAYWTTSISMVFANKYLVGGKTTNDISLFVSWFQCIMTVILVSLYNGYTTLRFGSCQTWNPPLTVVMRSKPVLAMAGFFVGMLSFNNMCLKLVGVSFYQVARSTTIIFVVIFSVLILKKAVSKAVVTCCALVACGFFLGIDQEKAVGSLSVKGVIFGVLSSVFIALTGIYTKKALDIVERDELKLTLCTNIIATVAFVPVVVLSGQLSSALAAPELLDPFFWLFLFVTGVLGCMMAWISAMQINVTSPVTHHISSNSKAVAQTIIAVIYYSETKRALWWFSVLMVVFGALSYAVVRMREESQLSSAPSLNTTATSSTKHRASPTDIVVDGSRNTYSEDVRR
jgi:GDP-fucose transporter C1